MEHVDVVGDIFAVHNGVEVLNSEEAGGGHTKADEKREEDPVRPRVRSVPYDC